MNFEVIYWYNVGTIFLKFFIITKRQNTLSTFFFKKNTIESVYVLQ